MQHERSVQSDTHASDVESFQRQILTWYEAHRRDLPWRGDPDPYHVLVSEVRLQQTQAEVVGYIPATDG